MAIQKHGFMVDTVDPQFDGTIESLQAYIANMSSAVRDKAPKSDEKLWNRLMKEAYGDKPSSVFKFIPCKLEKLELSYLPANQLFGFFEMGEYYTSARELLNWGWTWEKILPTVDFTHYRAFKGMTMYKVYQQLRTHTVPHWISHSQRYTESEHGYWYPYEFKAHQIENYNHAHNPDKLLQESWNRTVQNYTPIQLQTLMKLELAIPRREIYALGSDMLQKRVFSGGGYLNNPNDLPHLFNQRGKDPHTQLETKQWTQMLMEELGYEH